MSHLFTHYCLLLFFVCVIHRLEKSSNQIDIFFNLKVIFYSLPIHVSERLTELREREKIKQVDHLCNYSSLFGHFGYIEEKKYFNDIFLLSSTHITRLNSRYMLIKVEQKK